MLLRMLLFVSVSVYCRLLVLVGLGLLNLIVMGVLVLLKFWLMV